MAACAHRNGVFVALNPVAARSIAHGTRRKVGLSGHLAHEGERHIVAWHIGFFLRPATLFHAEHPLVVQYIREGTAQTSRRIKTMIVKEQLVAGAMAGNALCHLYGSLVVSVEEIHLEAFDAHGCIFAAGFVEMLVQYVKHRPQHDVDTLLATIGNQPRQVNVSNCVHDVAFRRIVPAFVEHDILQSEAGSEVNIILISFGVDTSFEVHTTQVPVVPPIPRHFSRLNPAGGSNFVRRSKRIDKVVNRHLRILLADGEDAPRIGSCTL